MKRRKGSRERFRGAALAEAAIVMMLLCMVTLGAVQYGWFFYCLHTATNAARQGARVASVLDGSETDGDNAIKAALGGDTGLLYTKADIKKATVSGTIVTGQVRIPTNDIALLPGLDWLPLPAYCQNTVTMAKEGG